MRAYKFGQKWEIGQKSPALTGLRKTDAAIPVKPFNSSRNQRFREELEPITTNARGGAIRESRSTRGFLPKATRKAFPGGGTIPPLPYTTHSNAI